MFGQIKWFKDSRGFGMITPSDGGGPIFLIGKGKCYSEGQVVTFRVKMTSSGRLRAVYVRVING
jgi:cold shock CspA family protein